MLLVCMCGLPRSGKSTEAWRMMREHGAVVVSPDAVRLAMHGAAFNPWAERFVWATVHAMLNALFLSGHALIVVDATNTTRKRRLEWVSPNWQTAYHVIPTPRLECIHRAGDDKVMVGVINRMADQWEDLYADETTYHPDLLAKSA